MSTLMSTLTLSPKIAATTRCLDRGHWRPIHKPRNLSAVRFSGQSHHPDGARYRCEATRKLRGLDLQTQAWECNHHNHHNAASRSPVLRDPLTSSFDGAFSTRPIQIAVLSDSLGAQVRSALEGAIAANPDNLRMISFARGNARANSALKPLNLATIPSEPDGVLSLLDSIDWGASSRAATHSARRAAPPAVTINARHVHDTAPPPTSSSTAAAAAQDRGGASKSAVRILLASSGMWYNLRPYCNGTGAHLFGLSSNSTCGHKVLGHNVRPQDVPLNHSSPQSANPTQFWRQYHRHFGTVSVNDAVCMQMAFTSQSNSPVLLTNRDTSQANSQVLLMNRDGHTRTLCCRIYGPERAPSSPIH